MRDMESFVFAIGGNFLSWDLEVWVMFLIFVVRKVTIYMIVFERIFLYLFGERWSSSWKWSRRVFKSFTSGVYRESVKEDVNVRLRSVSWKYQRFLWNRPFMAEKIFVSCVRVRGLSCWLFAQRCCETRTTICSLKWQFAVLLLCPMLVIFGQVVPRLSERCYDKGYI